VLLFDGLRRTTTSWPNVIVITFCTFVGHCGKIFFDLPYALWVSRHLAPLRLSPSCKCDSQTMSRSKSVFTNTLGIPGARERIPDHFLFRMGLVVSFPPHPWTGLFNKISDCPLCPLGIFDSRPREASTTIPGPMCIWEITVSHALTPVLGILSAAPFQSILFVSPFLL